MWLPRCSRVSFLGPYLSVLTSVVFVIILGYCTVSPVSLDRCYWLLELPWSLVHTYVHMSSQDVYAYIYIHDSVTQGKVRHLNGSI